MTVAGEHEAPDIVVPGLDLIPCVFPSVLPKCPFHMSFPKQPGMIVCYNPHLLQMDTCLMYTLNRLWSHTSHIHGFPLTRVFENAPTQKETGRLRLGQPSHGNKRCTATTVSKGHPIHPISPSDLVAEPSIHPLTRDAGNVEEGALISQLIGAYRTEC